jgi:hypothetical protein
VGTGKSAALAELERRGHKVVDTDYGGLTDGEPGSERLWREDRIEALLEHEEGVLFISGAPTTSERSICGSRRSCC